MDAEMQSQPDAIHFPVPKADSHRPGTWFSHFWSEEKATNAER